MHESGTGHALTIWIAPQCPFRVEYSPRVMDDIRLAVMDAFFSLPRGGAEIGGVLLGRYDAGRLLILDYAALDCEHATGPSFTLSARDEDQLRKLLSRTSSEFPGLVPVGWYHSHTRTEIFLSEADLAIHRRYFPEPWQVALVLKPHAFHPTRAGFFFREASGHLHASEPYQEIVVEALPMRPVRAPGPVAVPKLDARPSTIRLERNPSIGFAEAAAVQPAYQPPEEPTVEAEAHSIAEPVLPDDVSAVASEPPVPQFLVEPETPSRKWHAMLAVGILAAAGAAGYATRDQWLNRVMAMVRPKAPAPAAPSLGLKAMDQEGQLQITWDRNAAPVRRAVEAILEISDSGPLPQAITLDQAHLQNGFFTYGRQSGRVDVKLILHQAEGQQISDITTFLGKAPPPRNPEDDPEVRKERERLAEEAAKLKSTMDSQAARTRKLEKDLKVIKDQMKTQQQRRLVNQLPEGKP
jgi:proteasome lid subunit RPN8/RPN11